MKDLHRSLRPSLVRVAQQSFMLGDGIDRISMFAVHVQAVHVHLLLMRLLDLFGWLVPSAAGLMALVRILERCNAIKVASSEVSGFLASRVPAVANGHRT